MKILIVCSTNSGNIAPFILEQGQALVCIGVELEYFTIRGKGATGYLKNYKRLIATINQFNPELIHAHYGLSGLLANLQRSVPVITTYHGSDINNRAIFPFSRLCMMLSEHNIFVSQKNLIKSGLTRNYSIIPCGVDAKLFLPVDKEIARKEMGLGLNKKYVLFAGTFENEVKNASLARTVINGLPEVKLFELKGYSRKQVMLLMNAVDVVLMTSFTEGSPQFIKEALACNCPIVSVEVGDVHEVVQGVEGCFITTYDQTDVTEKLQQALEYAKRTEGRKRIFELKLDSESIALRIMAVYRTIL